MPYSFLTALVVLIHFGFVLFVVFGGFAVIKWRWLVWVHIPVVAWGALIEFTGWICPLTPLENWLRVRAGKDAYEVGFIDHYIFPLLYPDGLTRQLQYILGALAILINIIVYWWIVRSKV